MNRRSSALMTKPCPTGEPPAVTCAFTGCDRNVGLMPDKNIATTMANGHRLFAPSFLNDIRSSSTCDCHLLLRDNSRPPLRPSGALALPARCPHTCLVHLLLVIDGSARAGAEAGLLKRR